MKRKPRIKREDSAGNGHMKEISIEIDEGDRELLLNLSKECQDLHAKVGAMRVSFLFEERRLIEQIVKKQNDLRQAASMIASKKKLSGNWDLDPTTGTFKRRD